MHQSGWAIGVYFLVEKYSRGLFISNALLRSSEWRLLHPSISQDVITVFEG